MAKRNNQTPGSQERVDTLIHDKRGNLRLRIGFETLEYEEDGRDVVERKVDNVETSHGTVWNSSLQMRQGPDRVMLATCDKCEEEVQRTFFRSDSKMTLACVPEMARCQNCRVHLCPKHFYISKYDGCPRCRRHNFWHSVYQLFIRPLLWQQV
ncbi:hypothetical protein ACFL5F_03245 [Planctomycetota bacterium]